MSRGNLRILPGLYLIIHTALCLGVYLAKQHGERISWNCPATNVKVYVCGSAVGAKKKSKPDLRIFLDPPVCLLGWTGNSITIMKWGCWRRHKRRKEMLTFEAKTNYSKIFYLYPFGLQYGTLCSFALMHFSMIPSAQKNLSICNQDRLFLLNVIVHFCYYAYFH